MKWKDSEKQEPSDEKPEKEYFDEEEIATWEKDDGKMGAAPLQTQKSASTIWIGIAIIAVFAGLVIFLMPKFLSTNESSRILALEAKLRGLEERLGSLADVDQKVSRIWEQAQSYEKFKERFERTDASMSLRMDHLATSLDTLQKRFAALEKRAASSPPVKTTPAAPAKPKTTAAATPKKSQPRYHTVAKGETLFRISQQYNMKVEELLKLNKLPAGTVIQPGQRLIVGTK